jgi:hypothetical protein
MYSPYPADEAMGFPSEGLAQDAKPVPRSEFLPQNLPDSFGAQPTGYAPLDYAPLNAAPNAATPSQFYGARAPSYRPVY